MVRCPKKHCNTMVIFMLLTPLNVNGLQSWTLKLSEFDIKVGICVAAVM